MSTKATTTNSIEELIVNANRAVEALKYDENKPDLSILPYAGLDLTAKAFEFGAAKYGRNNYKKGMEWSRVLAAGMRHLSKFAQGEDLDEESGLSHLGHAGACIMMAAYYYSNGVGRDDR